MKAKYLFSAALIGMSLFAVSASAKTKEVTIWSWFVNSTMQKSIDAYEKAHPDVKIKYTYYILSPDYLTALKAASAAGSMPDIIGLFPGSLTQQYRNDLVPLNGLAAKTWGKDWTDQIFLVNRNQMRMGNPAGDNNYYLIPQESQVLCIWYNRKIFEKLGIGVPRTYAELKAAAHKLSKNGYIPMFQGAADNWPNENVFLMIANQFSPGVVEQARTGKIKWTSPDLVSAMKDWKKLFDDGIFQQGALGAHEYPTGAQLFRQGKVGMMALGSWWMQESKFPPPLSEYVKDMAGYDFFYLPPLSKGSTASPPVGGVDIGYGLTKNGEKDDAAWGFLASLINGKALQPALNDLNDLPAFKGHELEPNAPKHVKEMYARFMVDLAKAQNQRFAYPSVSQALDDALAGVAAGSVEPEQALMKVQAATDKALKK